MNCFINVAHRLIRDQLGYDASIYEFFSEDVLKITDSSSSDKNIYVLNLYQFNNSNNGEDIFLNLSKAHFKSEVGKHLKIAEKEDSIFTVNLIDEMLYNIARIGHKINTGTKNILLVGENGIGRKTCTRIACLMSTIKFNILSMTLQWNDAQFLNVVKRSLVLAGAQKRTYLPLSRRAFLYTVISYEYYLSHFKS